MYAARSGNKETVEFLINKGLDVNAKANDGLTALKVAISNHDEEMVDLLKRYGAKE